MDVTQKKGQRRQIEGDCIQEYVFQFCTEEAHDTHQSSTNEVQVFN